MGATLTADGATFRVWAPRALRVHLRLGADIDWTPDESNALVESDGGHWMGFAPNVQDGDAYRLWVVGQGSTGPKRDPQARELGPGFPHCDCIVRERARLPLARPGLPAARLQRPDHLSVPRRNLLRRRRARQGPPRAGRRQIPRRARPCAVSGGPRRQRDPAAARRRVRDGAQPRLQRHGLLLARDGLHRAGRRPRSVPRDGQRAPRRQGAGRLWRAATSPAIPTSSRR